MTSRGRKAERRPRRGAKGLLLFASVTLSLAVLEVGLRLTETAEHRKERLAYESFYRDGACRASVFSWNETLGWTACPNTSFDHEVNGWKARFTTDAEGRRVVPSLRTHPPPAPSARVLLIGDSFAFGMGAHDDETIDSFLARGAPEALVVNDSAPGWSPEQYLAALDARSGAVRPTHVYVLITHVNDLVILENATAYNIFKPTVKLRPGEPPRLVPPSELARFKPRGRSLVWSSRIGYLLANVLEPAYLRRLCGLEKPYGMPPSYEAERLELYSASRNARGDFDTLWERFDYVLERMSARARVLHARLSLVILPLGDVREIVERRKELGALPKSFELRPSSDYAVDVVLSRVKAAAARRGLGVLDPTPAFDSAKRQGLPVHSPESHYGPVGNRLIAEAILSDVCR